MRVVRASALVVLTSWAVVGGCSIGNDPDRPCIPSMEPSGTCLCGNASEPASLQCATGQVCCNQVCVSADANLQMCADDAAAGGADGSQDVGQADAPDGTLGSLGDAPNGG